MQMNIPVQKPWYAQPWVWLLIALPASAVVGGIITIWLAVSTSDGLVVDDYYQRGKEINLDLARDRAAATDGITASLALDAASSAVDVTLQSATGRWPATIRFSLLHPTRAGKDVMIDLLHSGAGHYHGNVPAPSAGHWYIQLEAQDWRLSGTLQVPQSAPLVLVPAP